MRVVRTLVAGALGRVAEVVAPAETVRPQPFWLGLAVDTMIALCAGSAYEEAKAARREATQAERSVDAALARNKEVDARINKIVTSTSEDLAEVRDRLDRMDARLQPLDLAYGPPPEAGTRRENLRGDVCEIVKTSGGLAARHVSGQPSGLCSVPTLIANEESFRAAWPIVVYADGGRMTTGTTSLRERLRRLETRLDAITGGADRSAPDPRSCRSEACGSYDNARIALDAYDKIMNARIALDVYGKIAAYLTAHHPSEDGTLDAVVIRLLKRGTENAQQIESENKTLVAEADKLASFLNTRYASRLDRLESYIDAAIRLLTPGDGSEAAWARMARACEPRPAPEAGQCRASVHGDVVFVLAASACDDKVLVEGIVGQTPSPAWTAQALAQAYPIVLADKVVARERTS